MSYSNSNNVFKNSDTIRIYGVGKHNHPGDRSNVNDDNRHCDDEVDDDVLDSCLDTYMEWSTECPNMMLHDQMQYENSKDSRAGMFADYYYYYLFYSPLRQKRKNKYIIEMHTTGPTAKEIL